MAKEPFIGEGDRPDLTIDLEAKVGDLTVRELAIILGVEPRSCTQNHLSLTEPPYKASTLGISDLWACEC